MVWGKSHEWGHKKTAANSLLFSSLPFDKLHLFYLAVRRMPGLVHLGGRVLKYTDKFHVQVDHSALQSSIL